MLGVGRAALARMGALLVLAVLLGLSTRALLAVRAAGNEVAWPPSVALVVGEVVTRGVTASDQYVELYNASPLPVEMGGLELDYVTASGTTTTVKQSWSELDLPTGAHLLIANAAGSYATMADGTFSGGFSTVGGSLVIRDSATGAVIDALSWGSAANDFVEDTPGMAPPTGGSLERLPGAGSNWVDTNDNAVDTFVQPAPLAQNLASPTQPAPIPSPSATESACGTAQPTDTPSTMPPTLTPAPTPTVMPSLMPSPTLSIADARAQPIGGTVAVIGTVTVGQGRIPGDATIAVQDDSGGIYARLPASSSVNLGTGDIVRIEGVLAAPYGNLEIRPRDGGVAVLGHGPEVAPRDFEAGELGEATEGLLGRLAGTVDSISASSSGSVTVMLSDASGVGRIFIYDTLGLGAADFVRGERLSVTGLAGDRLGLYRLWPRSPADIVHLGGPAPTPTPTPARASATPSDPPADVVSIAEALRRTGDTVTVEGTVSVHAGLLDSDSRRVTIQDSTGAILVRLPDNESTAVGDRIRVGGVVGTYYGAPQLAADSLRGLSHATLNALVVRSAPLTAALEWRLVTVTGQISSISRDGDAWRAELTLDGGSVPVSGLSRSGIPATAVAEGRSATITGLVKRAYPTATDQRFSLVPRGPADIVLGEPVASQRPPSPSGALPGDTPPQSSDAPTVVGTGAGRGGLTDVALDDLGAHLGEMVAVGGRVAAVDRDAITISDESGNALLLLGGSAADLATVLAAGDLLNATGIVVDGPDGSPAIAVADATAITRLAQVVATLPPPTQSPAPSSWWATSPPRTTTASAGTPGALSLLLLVGLLLAGAGLLAAAHPRVRAAIGRRLAGIRTHLAAVRTTHSKRGAG
jgi:hypothetical protein